MPRYVAVAISIVVLGCSREATTDVAPTPPASTPDAAASPCAPRRAEAGDVRCEDACFESLGPTLRLALDPSALDLPASPAGTQAIGVGLFFTTSHHEPKAAWSEEDVAAQARNIVTETNLLLAQCALHVRLETAQVVA